MAQERHGPLAKPREALNASGHVSCVLGSMRKSSVFLEPDDAGGHQVLLTLRRGVSSWGAWAFDAPDAGMTIIVGPSASCDWQIASPGVSPLFLAFTGEALLARAIKHDERVRLNGHALGEIWVQLSTVICSILGRPRWQSASHARCNRRRPGANASGQKAGASRAEARRAAAAAEREERSAHAARPGSNARRHERVP